MPEATRPVIPAACPKCGAVFPSRLIGGFGGNVKGLYLEGNIESCPFCGAMAHTADGVFDVANGVLTLVSGPAATREMLATLATLVHKAYVENLPSEELVRQVEKLDPTLGKEIRKIIGGRFSVTILLLILLAIKQCTVEVKIDANKLIDQLTKTPPAVVLRIQNDGPI